MAFFNDLMKMLVNNKTIKNELPLSFCFNLTEKPFPRSRCGGRTSACSISTSQQRKSLLCSLSSLSSMLGVVAVVVVKRLSTRATSPSYWSSRRYIIRPFHG